MRTPNHSNTSGALAITSALGVEASGRQINRLAEALAGVDVAPVPVPDMTVPEAILALFNACGEKPKFDIDQEVKWRDGDYRAEFLACIWVGADCVTCRDTKLRAAVDGVIARQAPMRRKQQAIDIAERMLKEADAVDRVVVSPLNTAPASSSDHRSEFLANMEANARGEVPVNASKLRMDPDLREMVAEDHKD